MYLDPVSMSPNLSLEIIITKIFGLSQRIYFLQCCVMYPEDITRVDRITYKPLPGGGITPMIGECVEQKN